MNKRLFIPAVLGIICTGVSVLIFFTPKSYSNITSYEECGAAGFPILETYPEQCRTPDGRSFTRVIKNDFSDLIHMTTPQLNSVITSSLTITGEARGTWYFKGSFPVQLLDSVGNVIAQGSAQAQGDWMTENFVPFKTTLTFTQPTTAAGTLIIHNDNPSGVPQNAKEVRIPIRFGGSSATSTATLNQSITLHKGEKSTLQNGLLLTLKEINDSRCKPNVQCVWAGELSALFAVSLNGSSADVRLGAVNNKNVTWNGFVLTLQSATREIATVVVSTISSPSGISGIIHVGPTCPVERMPPDPHCAPGLFTDAKMITRNKTSGSLVDQSVSDKKGSFRITLAPGVYTIDVSPDTNSFLPRCETKEAIVKPGEITSVDISCDSGIR